MNRKNIYNWTMLLAVDKNTDKYGYIDREGNEVFPCLFDDAEDLSEGLAVVMLDGKHGFIDAKGNCTLDLGK